MTFAGPEGCDGAADLYWRRCVDGCDDPGDDEVKCCVGACTDQDEGILS